jgi:hypothetical protein
MDTVLFDKDIEKKLNELFKADDYHFEQVEINLASKQSHNDRIELEKDAYYYLASTMLDIPVTAALYIASENNFLSTSKTDWEFDNALRLERFRNYLHVRTENASNKFSFKLKFLKVTPYRL